MAKVKRRVLVTLALCLSVCLAGREDKLAYKDDLEKMLRDLEDIPQDEPEKTTLDKAGHGSLDSKPKLDPKPVPPPRPITPTTDHSPGGVKDILDQISRVIEDYRRNQKQKTQPNDDSRPGFHSPSTIGVTPSTTTEHADSTQKDNKMRPPSKSASERERLLKDLLDLLGSFSRDHTSTENTSTTAVTSTRLPENNEKLKEEALDVAARAAKLYLHLVRS